ncbi:DUF4252 domain-containing protein [bacterium]|nr:DUF4252 domain-containing protein [bacterium]
MKKRIGLSVLVILILLTQLQAQDTDVTKLPGYVDLEQIPIPSKAGKITNITLGPSILGIAQQAVNGDDELSETLSGLFSIRVKTFEIDSQIAEELKPKIEAIEEKLNGENWQRIVEVKDLDEYTTISMKYDKNKAAGLLIMSLEDDEASFVNIVGSIDFEKIGKLGGGLHIDALDSLKRDMDE